jgi:hypothetical protein
MSHDDSDRLQWYQGPRSATQVEVYVRGHGANVPSTARLSLKLKGPFCQRTRTLPAGFLLAQVSPELWKATVVDPCYWTPAIPALYRLQIEDATGRAVRQVGELALRRLQTRGADLWMDGRRWVFRAANSTDYSDDLVAGCSELHMGLMLDRLTDPVAAVASRSGTPLAVRLSDDHWQADLARAAACPATHLAVLSSGWSGDRDMLRAVAADLLFVVDTRDDAHVVIPAWADAVLCSEDRRVLESVCGQRPARPVIAYRFSAAQSSERTVSGLRRACEQLQRDLAPEFDLSGYIVGRH